ncbi:MAG: ATP-binding protein, partial [Treponema sp.]|nr:ATP-binding protein [Treponema sp.]
TEQDKKDEALSVYINRFSPIFNTFTYYINIGFEKNLDYSLDESIRINDYTSFNAYLIFFLILLSLVISIILALAVTKSIAVPLSQLGLAAEKIALGELNINLDQSQSNDEIANLSHSLNETIQQLIEVQQLKVNAMVAQHKKEKAEASTKSKSDFLARMSHEIRTPMNAIVGMSELLLRNNLTDESRSYAKDIKQAGGNLISIINDILDFSKIESGKLEIIPVNYQLASIINDTASIIRMRLLEKPIQFYIDIEDSISNNLIGDDIRLRQIFINLLSNAVKYTEEGQITLSIKTEKQNDKTIWLKISVTDTGKGIKPEDLKNLFNDFAQLDAVKNRGIEGTGLGLAITKRLCVAMDGNISAESEYGKGTVFTVIIPQEIHLPQPFAAAFINNDKQGNREYTENSSMTIYTFPKARVLVVDDILLNLKVAEGLLTPYKMTVDTCQNGALAIEIVKNNNYDLIFMDHMMPEMNGIETTKIIREWEDKNKREFIPIVALTANAIAGMREMFIEKGFNDYLSKPIDIYKLDEILNHWIPEEKREQKIETQNTSTSADRALQKAFRFDAQNAIVTLKESISENNINLFTVTAHAIKSALTNMGEHEVSQTAFLLEDAGLNGNIIYIKENIEIFIKTLDELIEKYRIPQSVIAENIKEDTAYLEEQLRIIKTACNDYDIDAAYAALNRLKEKPWSEKTKHILEQIYDKLFIFSDFDGVFKLLETGNR